MITPNRGFSYRLDRYLESRSLSQQYAKQLRDRNTLFIRWLEERGIAETEISPAIIADEANAWLASLFERKVSAHTVDGYRRAFLAVWNFADNPDSDHPPLRLRKIKKPREVVRAFRHEHMRALIAEAEKLKGEHPDGNRRADWWAAIFESAYSTGLRRGDLVRVPIDDIGPDGRATVVQSKTGYLVEVVFSATALDRLGRLRHTGGLALPWPYLLRSMVYTFRRLRDRAGVDFGSLKYFRRAAGSYAERERPGSGRILLGQRSEAVFRQNYEDTTISRPPDIQPPPLGL